jgi:hypothetical protein
MVAGVASSLSTGDLNKSVRKTPFKCGSQTSIEEISLQLPGNLKVAALPKDVIHKDKSMSFKARYKQDGQKNTATRKLIRERAYSNLKLKHWHGISDVFPPNAAPVLGFHFARQYIRAYSALTKSMRCNAINRAVNAMLSSTTA